MSEIVTEQVFDTPGPIIEHERGPVDIQPTDDGRSELERHKEARGFTKKTEPPPPTPDGEPPPLPAAAKTDADKKPEQWLDPDTGDRYDMRHKVARRIKKVLEDRAIDRAEKEALRVERDELLRQMARGPQPKAEAAKPAVDHDAEPDHTDTAKYPEGQYDRAFIRDMATWAADQRVNAKFGTARAEQELQARRTAEVQQVSQWQETLPAAQQKYPDFDAALANIPNTPDNAPIVRLMMGSPVGNDLVYVLGTQPEAMKAYKHAPNAESRLRLLHHLEAQLIAAQRGTTAKPKTTGAPPPTSPVHAGDGPKGPIDWSRTDDPDQLQRWKSIRKARR
jgi:hypothetical protein